MSTYELPPSAKYVLDVVEREAPISRQDLLEETDLPETTLDRAVDHLQDGGYLHRTRKSGDLRQVVITSGET